MKKAVSFILALILVSMLLLPVGAEENASSMLVTKGALTYAIDDNFTIVACDPAVHVKDCTLPGIIDGYKVVRIGKDAFKDCTLLTDIKILEETTDIDEGAFGLYGTYKNLYPFKYGKHWRRCVLEVHKFNRRVLCRYRRAKGRDYSRGW